MARGAEGMRTRGPRKHPDALASNVDIALLAAARGPDLAFARATRDHVAAGRLAAIARGDGAAQSAAALPSRERARRSQEMMR
jgi:hypothetical protein